MIGGSIFVILAAIGGGIIGAYVVGWAIRIVASRILTDERY